MPWFHCWLYWVVWSVVSSWQYSELRGGGRKRRLCFLGVFGYFIPKIFLMPLDDGYGVLSGTLESWYCDHDGSDRKYYHCNMRVKAHGGHYRCPVDLDSKHLADGLQWRVVDPSCRCLRRCIILPMGGIFLMHGPAVVRLITIAALSFSLPASVWRQPSSRLKMRCPIPLKVALHGNRVAGRRHLGTLSGFFCNAKGLWCSVNRSAQAEGCIIFTRIRGIRRGADGGLKTGHGRMELFLWKGVTAVLPRFCVNSRHSISFRRSEPAGLRHRGQYEGSSRKKDT